MAITVTPTLPVIAATPSAAAPVLALQSGTVVNATVLNTLAENLVQIAIAGLSIDVLSEVPLQAGQNLPPAGSQTNNGTKPFFVSGGASTPAGRSVERPVGAERGSSC